MGYVAKDVTVVFVDLVGFTPLSATLTPQQLMRLLTKYFHLLDCCGRRCQMHKVNLLLSNFEVAVRLFVC